MRKHKYFPGNVSLILSLIILVLSTISACNHRENPVLNYFQDVELQYETDSQLINITAALNDLIKLPKEELAKKRYCDYTGKQDQWDLKQVLDHHFVPKRAQTFGNDFYTDVKDKEVVELATAILKNIEGK